MFSNQFTGMDFGKIHQTPSMKKLTVFLSCLALLTGGCEKIYDCPDCIHDRVKEFAKHRVCNDASVAEFLFQGEYVNVSSDGTCGADMGAAVYNENCEYMGFLGGIAGNLDINGVKFHDFAVFQRIIWQE
jgi:hypothetical protein